MKSLFILGRQAGISLAELESHFGSPAVTPLNSQVAALSTHPSPEIIDNLGGTTKICRLLTSTPKADWNAIENYLLHALPLQLEQLPEGKIKLGCSVYNIDVSTKNLEKTLLRIKKELRSRGKSVRIIPNKQRELSTAQTIHNKLTGEKGFELVICKAEDDGAIYFGQVIAVQNINAYAARDQERPKRDAKVGMLPPKLAQIIINLAAGERAKQDHPVSILDPFCGSGVLLQEALLMNYAVVGSDIDERMVSYSQGNLDWLTQKDHVVNTEHVQQNDITLLSADATNHTWEQPFDTIAAETYLGRAFSSPPQENELRKVMQDVDTIHQKFLKNVAKQTPPGFRLCIAVPSWHIRGAFKHLKVLESIGELGYNRLSFVHADNAELIYHREGQVVGRELVVLTRT